MSEQDLPVTYTVEQLARILHRSPETIRRLIKDGDIPAVKVGGRFLVTKETLDKILRGEISTDK